MTTINLPAQLMSLAGGQRTISLEGETLTDVFWNLDEIAPMIRSQIFHATGEVRQFVGLFLNGLQLTELGAEPIALPPSSQLTVVMAIAGG